MLISALATGPPAGVGGGSDRFSARELRVSQQISTFYEPSVQAMDTQLNALATLAVHARTVSGCVNSAFLGLERNRSAVGKTKAPLVAGGPQQLAWFKSWVFQVTVRTVPMPRRWKFFLSSDRWPARGRW